MFGIIAGAVISGAASYLSNKSSSNSAKKQAQNEIKAQKELAEQKRKYDLEVRKYRQDSAGAWAKFANPAYANKPFTPIKVSF